MHFSPLKGAVLVVAEHLARPTSLRRLVLLEMDLTSRAFLPGAEVIVRAGWALSSNSIA